MDVKTLCLGVLTQGEASGYDIKKTFECTFSHFFVAGFGSIYPALAELSREGLVSCREETQEGRPPRKVYALTDTGRAAFQQALETTPPRHRVRSEFLVLLYFAHLLPEARMREVLEQRLTELESSMAACAEFLEHGPDVPELRGARFATGLGHAVMNAARDYLRQEQEKILGVSA